MIRSAGEREPRFLTIDEALTLHETNIAQHGGSTGIRDRGLLESALAMPRQAFGGEFTHSFPHEMAAAYLFHVCKNHPFVDGNKRTALACCVVFLHLNGWTMTASQNDAVDTVLAVASGTMSKAEIAKWLVENSASRSD